MQGRVAVSVVFSIVVNQSVSVMNKLRKYVVSLVTVDNNSVGLDM